MGRGSLWGEELEKEKPAMTRPSLEDAGSSREGGRTKEGKAGGGRRLAGDEVSRMKERGRGMGTQNNQQSNIRRLNTNTITPWRYSHDLPLNVSERSQLLQPPTPNRPPNVSLGPEVNMKGTPTKFLN